MGLRTRKLIGGLAIGLWLLVFSLIAMAVIAQFERPGPLFEVLLYAVLGFVWILPLKPVFIWMGKGRRG